MTRFSERVGATQPRRQLQIGAMDQALRNALWNWILWMLAHERDSPSQYWWAFARSGLWDEFFRLPVDEVPSDVKGSVREWYKKAAWHEVYDLVEYVLENGNGARSHYDKRTNPEIVLNRYLERELSGYRAIRGKLVPISTAAEINEVRSAAERKQGFAGVAQHIDAALELLGKKPEPDYRNSIKESISAVEAAVKLLTGEKSGGIDKALAILEKQERLHGSFKTALSKLYGYTSDEDGIRHPILDESNITFAEAKFMLVACSAFANLLIDSAGQSAL